jgi:ornithine cyclodeaminase/alanine dehydrogenase
VKVIDFDVISGMNISPVDCYNWVSEMIAGKNEAFLPPKISLKPMDGVFCNVMPSIVDGFGGIKVVTRYPERVPALESFLTLYDVENGDVLALMDATWINAMRTGAVAAHAIIHLAKSDFSSIGMVGLGNTTCATMLVLAEVLKDRELTINLLKYKDQELDFAGRFSQYSNLSFQFFDSAEDMVSNSDVVVSGVTYMPQNLCEDKCYKKGVLVVPIHTLGFTNCDLFFDKVFADDYGHVKHFKYFDRFKRFAEMTDMVNGVVPGRESDDERILAYNIGVSIHDVNFAARIFSMVSQREDLPEVSLNSPKQKFWI